MADNLFDKIDQQGGTIDQIADKLKDVSVEDLYSLAKRTWDYQDYDMAQKYYNHIALLCPLDWEAPFYASLCNVLRNRDAFEWGSYPKSATRAFESTINYIISSSESDVKYANIAKAAGIIASLFREYIRLYKKPDNAKAFSVGAPNFKYELIDAYKCAIELLSEFDDQLVKDRIDELSRDCNEFIQDCESKDQAKHIKTTAKTSDVVESIKAQLHPATQPTEEYLSRSTVYCYEPNSRKLKKFRKRKILFASIWLGIDLILLAASVFFVVKSQYVIPLIISSISISIIYNIVCIVYYGLYKNKMLARSVFNLRNTVFYYDGDTTTIEIETRKGVAFYFCIFEIVFAFIATFIDAFAINPVRVGGLYIGFIAAFLKIFAYLPNAIALRYHYSQYIFDTKDSYMLFDGHKWHLAEKTPDSKE